MKTNTQKKSKPQNLMLYIGLFTISICYNMIFFILAAQKEHPATYVLLGSLFFGLSVFLRLKWRRATTIFFLHSSFL